MVSLQVTIDDEAVRAMLARVQRRMSDLTPAMREIGQIVRTSVIRNFETGGRPRKWKPLRPVTLARRKGKKILMIQGPAGGLAGSVHPKAHRDRAVIGTNKVYAAVHQFGARKGAFGAVTARVREHLRKTAAGKTVRVRAHARTVRLPWGDIPARPFLMVQDEDWGEIRHALAAYITEGTR